MTPVTLLAVDIPSPIHRVRPQDDVATALRDLAAGERLAVPGSPTALPIRGAVPRGHKLALRDVPAGGEVRKYGWPIGRASADSCGQAAETGVEVLA